MAGITPISSANSCNRDQREFPNPALQLRAGSRVGVLKKATTGPRWEPRDAVS